MAIDPDRVLQRAKAMLNSIGGRKFLNPSSADHNIHSSTTTSSSISAAPDKPLNPLDLLFGGADIFKFKYLLTRPDTGERPKLNKYSESLRMASDGLPELSMNFKDKVNKSKNKIPELNFDAPLELPPSLNELAPLPSALPLSASQMDIIDLIDREMKLEIGSSAQNQINQNKDDFFSLASSINNIEPIANLGTEGKSTSVAKSNNSNKSPGSQTKNHVLLQKEAAKLGKNIVSAGKEDNSVKVTGKSKGNPKTKKQSPNK